MSRTLVNVEGSHRKFYNIKQDGTLVTIAWGRIGSWTQSKVEAFASVAAAHVFATRKLHSKLSRGYVIVA